jgi:carboxypeptidase PM20D1
MSPVFYCLIGIGALLVGFIAVIAVRTALFRPRSGVKPDEEAMEFDRELVISNLRELVKCRTVSKYSHVDEDDGEFEKLISLLPKLYPHVYEKCTLTYFDDRGLLFRWEGKSHSSPAVLMAHYDVVPVSEEDWEKPPFDGVLEDGVLWGRGTLDTKVTFGSILFSANHLIKEGYEPENDVYFAFSGGEEVNGNGAVHIVKYFEDNHINPAFVLDEGGAVVEGVFPGVKHPCALVGIAEKGLLDLKYTVKSRGGHASAPKPHSPIPTLSSACCKLESHPYKSHLTKPVK